MTNVKEYHKKKVLGGVRRVLTTFIAGAQTTGQNKFGWLVDGVGDDEVIESVRIHALTAPAGSAFIADVHKNGTTIFTTQGDRPTIADGENASSTATPAVTALANGDRLTLDIDQIGSGTAGSNLFATITTVQKII